MGGVGKVVPKFGIPAGLTATEVWGATARTLTDISAEEIFDLPAIDDNYVMVSPVSSGTVNTYGSWVEFSADIGKGKRLIALLVHNDGGDELVPAELEVGEGGGSSEAAITRVIYTAEENKGRHVFYLWKSLTDNARITVRIKDHKNYAETCNVTMLIA